MPQIHPVSTSPMELEGSDITTLPEIHNNAEQAALLPSVETLTKKLDEIEAHLYDNPFLTAEKLADKSALLAQLVKQGNLSLWETFQNSVVATTREATRLTEQYRPHLSWPESYLHIFIDQKHLEPREFEKVNTHTGQMVTETETPAFVDYRRNAKQHWLEYAVESTRTASLLKLLQPAAASPDSNTASFDELLGALTTRREHETFPKQADNKVTQAKGALEAGLKATGEAKNNLLDIALDLSTAAMESFPEELSAGKATAYLIAATSVHDLAAQPNSFLPRLAEHEARDFRVRALEIASYWMTQSADMYRRLFDNPVGTITPESLPKITEIIADIKDNSQSINNAFWFDGVYRDDYERAAKQLDHNVRKIGQGAVILALRQPKSTEQSSVQPAAEPLEVAA